MNGNEKAARIIERLREIEILAEPRPFAEQLKTWGATDTWSTDIATEVEELIAMLDSLLEEVENGN